MRGWSKISVGVLKIIAIKSTYSYQVINQFLLVGSASEQFFFQKLGIYLLKTCRWSYGSVRRLKMFALKINIEEIFKIFIFTSWWR